MKRGTILLIDGNMDLLRGAECVLGEIATIKTASNATGLAAALHDAGPYEVILSALSLKGVESVWLLSELRALHPHSVRLLMAGKDNPRLLSSAINVSAPFRVLPKPFTAEELRQNVTDALVEYARATAERSIVEATMHGSLEAIAAMLASVQPAAFGRAVRLRRTATMLAEKLGLPDLWEVQIASLLSQFGTLSLPAELVERICHHQPIAAGEHAQLQAAIEATLHLLEPMPRLTRVCEILRSIELVSMREPQQGPTKEPSAAERVLTLAIDFDGLYTEHGSAEAALRVMESHIARYHASYFDVFREMVGTANGAKLIDILLSEVRIGQVFAADVRSPSDLLLVARGQPVTPPLVYKVRNDWQDFAAHTTVRVVSAKDARATSRWYSSVDTPQEAAPVVAAV